MKNCSPGKSHHEGISMVELLRLFPDDKTSEAWFAERRWKSGIHCPHCGSDNVQTGSRHRTMPYQCRQKACAKTGTVMEGSRLGFRVWMIATCLLSTGLKSVSSMPLHRDLGINQRSAWFLAHRLCAALAEGSDVSCTPSSRHSLSSGARP